MKNILQLSTLFLLMFFAFASCKKNVSKDYFEGGTAPNLTLTEVTNVEYANADKIALILNWTNPNYQFTTGVNSQDVKYDIMVDTAGSNFSNPYEITVAKDLSYTFTVAQFNDVMLNLNLATSVAHTLEIKVISSLSNNSVQLASDSIQYIATPYVIPPKVDAPASGELYLVGSATAGGWDNPVPVPNQQFTKIDDLHFTLTVFLSGGQEYLFIPVNGDWTHKYACKSKATQSSAGGDFGLDLSDNFPGPTSDGTYKIDVNFQTGKYTVTK